MFPPSSAFDEDVIERYFSTTCTMVTTYAADMTCGHNDRTIGCRSVTLTQLSNLNAQAQFGYLLNRDCNYDAYVALARETEQVNAPYAAALHPSGDISAIYLRERTRYPRVPPYTRGPSSSPGGSGWHLGRALA
jgi:hypothetical protein